MQTAIATVCLSGTLNEKLEAIAAARFKGVEIFENDLLSFDGLPSGGSAVENQTLGLEVVTFQPFRDFEGMPEPQRAKVFSRAERKFDLMALARLRFADGMQQCVADLLGGDRPGRGRFPRARRPRRHAGASASRSRRWRGVATSMTTAISGRSSDGRTILPVGLVLDSFHVLARGTELNAIYAIPQGANLPGSDRRRSQARHGLPLMEPPLPLLSGTGRSSGWRVGGRLARDRVRWADFAGDLQR